MSGSRLSDPVTGYITKDKFQVVRNGRRGAIVIISNKKGLLLSTLNAATFNAVDDFSTKQALLDCSPEKIALHAVVGGLLN